MQAVVQTMFQDSTIKRLLYNADSKRTYNDSVYIVRSELSDSILSAVKLYEKKIGYLPPDKRPYTYKNIADKQIVWLFSPIWDPNKTGINKNNAVTWIEYYPYQF